MTVRRFVSVWVPFAVILVAAAIACTAIFLSRSQMMNLTYGMGARMIVSPAHTAGWDTNYYSPKEGNAEDALVAGIKLSERIANDGQVLLKNNGALPLKADAIVTPFGFLYMHPNYGPYTGSAKVNSQSEILVSPKSALRSRFAINSASETVMDNATPLGLTESGYDNDVNLSAFIRPPIIEYDPQIYAPIKSSCAGTVGIVFIGRQAGESGDDYTADIAYSPLFDGSPHGVALSVYEKETVKFAKQNCDKVIVILNGTNPLELSPLTRAGSEYEADAILWMGGAGSAGFRSMASILAGAVNPSGRLVDTFAADYSRDPVFANYGSKSRYTNTTPDVYANVVQNTFVEYEEGIYLGYRYYETAAAVDEDFDYFAGVVYPFGYGLSYTQFTQEIDDFGYDGASVTMRVKVSNTGTRSGKSVVQVYYSPPYTDLTRGYGIEKSAVVLGGFGKSKLIPAGQHDYVTVSFEVESMASYCSARKNPDGTEGCYMLEGGEYNISLRNNSHEVIDACTVNIEQTIWYDAQNMRPSDVRTQGDVGSARFAVTNRFGGMTEYMRTRTSPLTRADWAHTQPAPPTDLTAPTAVVEDIMNNKTFDPATDEQLGDVEGSLVYNNTPVTERTAAGLVLSELRGLDYEDEKWDALLGQLNYGAADLMHLLTRGYMQTHAVAAIGKPLTAERDSPLGLTANLVNANFDKTTHCSYPSAPVLAASFDTDIAREFGQTVASEAAQHNASNLPINGWYAPAVNIHRGPFGSRHNEYYSEDPLLSGIVAAAVTEGAESSGLNVIIKHFACNNQDSTREGLNTWMTEQTLREIYLRPYEICIKQARSTVKYLSPDGKPLTKETKATRGIMTAKNSLGSVLCSANRALQVDVLRNEWGFRGIVITDIVLASGKKSGNLISKYLRGGSNIVMQFNDYKNPPAFSSNTMKNLVREAVHEICYAVVNGGAMQGVAPGGEVKYGLAQWQAVLIAADTAVAVLVAVFAAATLYMQYKKRRKK